MHSFSNALDQNDLEAPMGDLFSFVSFGRCQSQWVSALEDEASRGAPERRIIHAMTFRPHGRVVVNRLGLRPSQGYHKCGSRQDQDWVLDLRILLCIDGEWKVHSTHTNLEKPADGMYSWIELGGLFVDGAIFEVRRSGIDSWWTPWNLAAGAFVLETGPFEPASRNEALLEVKEDDGSLPRSLGSWLLEGGAMHLSLAQSRATATSFVFENEDTTGYRVSLLYAPAGSTQQGPFASAIGRPPMVDETVRCDIAGTTTCRDGSVRYDVRLGEGAIRYQLSWRSTATGLVLHIVKEVQEEIDLWESAAWRFSFDTRTSPTSVLGRLKQAGQTGQTELPAIVHVPRYGSVALHASGDEVWLRSDTDRSLNRNIVELKLGETALESGMFRQTVGQYEAEVTIDSISPELALQDSTPQAVRSALRQVLHTALTFRADTATLSNNGASMHCPISMDSWAEIVLSTQDIGAGIDPGIFLRYSLERWLSDAPGYASGRILQDGEMHLAEDEYLMTGSAALLGLARYLEQPSGRQWGEPRLEEIRRKIDEMAARDLDGDGLIESPFRTGVSGTGQWSTCWMDVVSFGWKDAFSNALLYDALVRLSEVLRGLGDEHGSVRLTSWATSLSENYFDTFYNPKTGWLAGWRCKNGELHDYAFLQLNGAAVSKRVVDADRGREMLDRLLLEMEKVGMPDSVLGMPGNLWAILDKDLADVMQGFPLGYYQNGGRTHAQTRHFLDGLYTAGLESAADKLLERLCSGMASGYSYGGNQTGVDWRYWDDRPCGYEGLLTDQFGFLATAAWRYGTNG